MVHFCILYNQQEKMTAKGQPKDYLQSENEMIKEYLKRILKQHQVNRVLKEISKRCSNFRQRHSYKQHRFQLHHIHVASNDVRLYFISL